MQLLTPLIRARIEMLVLDAIKRMPPNINPRDSRFLDWLESLIRYHAQNPLDPAEEKTPVLGGVGIADQDFPGDSYEPGTWLMESGWMHFVIGLELVPGQLHYTSSVMDRYTEAGEKEDAFLDEMIEPVDDETISFIVAEHVNGRASVQYPLTSAGTEDAIDGNHSTMTGKAKYLDQCNPGMFAASGVNNYNMGVYTTESGLDYFWIKVEDGEVSAATMKFTEIGKLLKLYLIAYSGVLSAEYWEWVEGYLFLNAKAPVDWYVIGTAEIEGDSLFYGAKFNWRGNKIAYFTHDLEYYGDTRQRVAARRYEITISEIGGGLHASTSMEEEKGWQPSDSRQRVFIPTSADSPPYTRVSFNSLKGCDAPAGWAGGAETHEETGIPVYGWYDRDGELIVVRWKKTEISADWDDSELEDWYANFFVCGAGSEYSQFEKIKYGYTTGFYIDKGDSAEDYSAADEDAMVLSWPSASPSLDQKYTRRREWLSNTVQESIDVQCATDPPQDYPVEHSSYKGYYCGDYIDYNDLQQGGCILNETRQSGTHSNASIEYKHYASRGNDAGGFRTCCVILPYYDAESAFLHGHTGLFGGEYSHKKRQHDSWTDYTVYGATSPIKNVTIRLPYVEGTHGVSQFMTMYTIAILDFDQVLGDHTWTYYDDAEIDVAEFRYVLATNDGAELIKAAEFVDGDWGDDVAYGALIEQIECNYQYVDIPIYNVNSALEQDRFYGGDLVGVSPPEPDTNTELDPDALGPTTGRFVGIA